MFFRRSDSSTTLHWINCSKTKSSVAERVADIIDWTLVDQWGFNPGLLNSASTDTKGLKSTKWWIQKNLKVLLLPKLDPSKCLSLNESFNGETGFCSATTSDKFESGLHQSVFSHSVSKFYAVLKLWRLLVNIKRPMRNMKARMCQKIESTQINSKTVDVQRFSSSKLALAEM